MIEKLFTPEFILVEDDPLVLMDIRDMIMREFGSLPLNLETVAGLGDLLAEIGQPVVVIASCAMDDLMAGVRHVASDIRHFSAVMLMDPPKETSDLPFNVTFLPSPFSSDLLMESITTACEHLRLNRT
tara:strand:- start:4171 stop:4554 length:384 start_codon:yes stop_codon:yes gene_type:complete